MQEYYLALEIVSSQDESNEEKYNKAADTTRVLNR